MKKVVRAIVYVAAFVASVAVFTWRGYVSGMQLFVGDSVSAANGLAVPAPKPYDSGKPTVAILVGTQTTETSDFLVPYEIFSAVGAYNVYTVTLQRQLSTLGGGLDLLPDYSLDGLDKMLGKSPELIVVPNIDNNQPAIDPAILNWLRGHAAKGSQILSICMGARTLAEAGLLDGRPATTHWNYIDTAEQRFPNVRWRRGLRYVDDGSIISSAGILSGIDASLHVVALRLGLPAAQRIANDLHYSDFSYVTNPQAVQYRQELPDAIFFINFLFGSPRSNDGVLLYNGVGEIDLSSVFDTYPGSLRTVTRSVAPVRQWITTRHGLVVLPRYDYTSAPAVDRLLVPGQDARQLATTEAIAWAAQQKHVPVDYLHADLPDRFAFDAALLDLASTQNIPTARVQAKSLEYRPTALTLVGAGWPWLLTLEPVLVGLAGVLLVFAGQHLLTRRQLRSELPQPSV